MKSKQSRYVSDDTYQLTDGYIDTVESYSIGREGLQIYKPSDNKIVGTGSWVVISADIPVEEKYKPMKWAMYWAVPCTESKNMDGFDQYGRYKVEIYVPVFNQQSRKEFERVCLFPHEYIVANDELFEQLKDGYNATELQFAGKPVNLELISQGRALFEEEREVIWALQLDGLSEEQACQEYFLATHVDGENTRIMYVPKTETLNELVCIFG